MSTSILVVDDEPAMLRSVARVLRGHDVRSAETAAAALEVATTAPPELAVLDIRMPEMDGFELLRKLRELRPDMSVIFMTGYLHELDAQLIRSIRQQAFYFIPKPFDREVFLTIVERCLELRRLEAENRAHTQRLESELREARDFQLSLMPKRDAAIGRVEVAAYYEACDEVSGDFFDYVSCGADAITILVADVSGHGASAAMLTTVVKSGLHAAHVDGYDPLSVIRQIHRGMQSFDDDRFVTVFCGRLSGDGRLEYVSAGSPPPFVSASGEPVRELGGKGLFVSPALDIEPWTKQECRLSNRERVLLYTDGVTEASGGEGLYGRDRLRDAFARHGDATCRNAVDDLHASLDEFTAGHPADDDRTFLVFRLL